MKKSFSVKIEEKLKRKYKKLDFVKRKKIIAKVTKLVIKEIDKN